MLTLGSYTKKFESEFARFVGVPHAIAVNSGTSALQIALTTSGITEEDDVLVPTNTFSATPGAVLHAGGYPVFTDIDPETLCMSLENVKRSISAKTKGVIAVHIGGLVCPDIEEIRRFCYDGKLALIEDAAHAHGSTFQGKVAGSFGDSGCFSFYPTKVMTTGEGGMITTGSDSIASGAMVLRDQGKKSFDSNEIVDVGYNWRMDEISAALGILQLGRLPEILRRRNEIARIYNQSLIKTDRIRPVIPPSGATSNYYKYVAVLANEIPRDVFKEKLKAKGVRCGGEVYSPPCHLQPVYRTLLGTRKGQFPVAEELTERMVCLPMFTQLTDDQVRFVCEKIDEVLEEF